MLTIREAQMQHLEQEQMLSFEQRCLEFIGDQFPEQLAMSGEEVMRERIRADIQRAFMQEISDEADVMKYLYLTNLLGADFDADPRYMWLAPIIQDRGQTPRIRLDHALDAVAQRLDAGIALADPLEMTK